MSHKETVSQTPYRQIRAKQDDATITVYQAYSAEIAIPAIQFQKFDASANFSPTRMTWIKPSWAWMLYRSGYSYKDPRQSQILAITLTKETFTALLRKAILAHGSKSIPDDVKFKKESVRVQWDPERTVRLEKLPYRSIQIGVPGVLVPEFVAGIVRIQDVTETARELKKILDEDVEKQVTLEEMIDREFVPMESKFVVDDELREILCMDGAEHFEPNEASCL